MIEKVYIWDDLSLINQNVNQKIINDKLNKLKEIADNSRCKLEILKKDIILPFCHKINKLSNRVTIGTRPQKFLTNEDNCLAIMCRRKIQQSGFASECEIIVDNEIYNLKSINIIEDICVTGTTMDQIIYTLNENFDNINVYFLIAYNETIKMLKSKYEHINIFCDNILYERPIHESTCIFLSDLLYEKLGDITYIEHIKNINLFENYTDSFCNEVNIMKEEISK